MKFGYLAAAAFAAGTAFTVPAAAQDAAPAAPAEGAPAADAAAAAPAGAAAIAAGATVYGPDGAEVGTIASLEGGNATINTGSVTATVPATAISAGAKGPTIGWNKAQLEEAVSGQAEASAAALETALVAGAQVFTVDGQPVGPVKEVNAAGMVVVEHSTAGAISLPKAQFAMHQDKVTFMATAADLNAAVAGQAAS
ncbi:hypothetical protein GRI97_10325 [Altererythrobacter xixiisoli]|uniref:PRC-barrel domain-containing protein n=1 Tax=Croceibacterium xixiisoli TaxID=1476466 RepID=A0A6I4TT92_9SPHN|nr:hypothetical protein [Croceibacterium xixiisoli]MXO99385.1 hypothetical protein [Croceibacterium xixiisoli]